MAPSKRKSAASENGGHFESWPNQLKRLKVSKVSSGGALFRGSSYHTGADFDDGGGGGDGGGSQMLNALAKWRDLNLSEGYQRLQKDLSPLAASLGLVLHHRSTIAKKLEEAAEAQLAGDATPLGLEPILDLWAALARDIKDLFEPFLETFVNQAVLCLFVEDTNVIKMSYGRLNETVKIVQWEGSGNLQDQDIVDLLLDAVRATEKARGKKFADKLLHLASLCVAHFLKRAKKREGLEKSLLTRLSAEEDPSLVRVISRGLFASCCITRLNEKCLLRVTEAAHEIIVPLETLNTFWEQGLEHFAEKDADSRLTLIGRGLDLALNKIKDGADKHFTPIRVISDLRWNETAPFKLTLERLCKANKVVKSVSNLEATVTKLVLKTSKLSVDEAKVLMEALYECQILPFKPLSLIFCQDKESRWHQVLPQILSREIMKLDAEDIVDLHKIIDVVNALMEERDWQDLLFELHDCDRDDLASVPNRILALLQDDHEDNSLRVKILNCILFLRPLSFTKLQTVCKSLESKILQRVSTEKTFDSETSELMLLLTRVMRKTMCPLAGKVSKKVYPFFHDQFQSSEMISECFYLLVSPDPDNAKEVLGKESVRLFVASLGKALLNAKTSLRVYNLKSMICLVDNEDFSSLLQAEETESSLQSYREKLRLLQAAANKHSQSNVSALSQDVLFRVLISSLCDPLSLVSTGVINIAIEAYRKLEDKQRVWKIFLEALISPSLSETQPEFRPHLLKILLEDDNLGGEKCSELATIYLENFTSYGTKTSIAFLTLLTKNHGSLKGKEKEKLASLSIQSMASLSEALQLAAIKFASVHFKQIRGVKDELTSLVDKQEWRKKVRDLSSNFSEAKPVVRRALIAILIGSFKRTSQMKAQQQSKMRKVIIENVGLLGKDFLIQLIKSVANDVCPRSEEEDSKDRLNYALPVDLCSLSRPLINDEDGKNEIDEILARIIVQMSHREGTFEETKKRSKYLSTIKAVFKNSANFGEAAMRKFGIVEKCLGPLIIRDGTPRLTKKVIALFDTWIEGGLTPCFLIAAKEERNLGDIIAEGLDKSTDDGETLTKLLNFTCKLSCALKEIESHTDGARELAEKLVPICNNRLTSEWLSKPIKSLDGVNVQARFDCLRASVATKSLISSPSAILAGLGSNFKAFAAKSEEDWSRAVAYFLLLRHDAEEEPFIPLPLLKTLMTIKDPRNRDLVVKAMHERLGLSTTESVEDILLDLNKEKHLRSDHHVLYLFYSGLWLMYAKAEQGSTMGLNVTLGLLALLKDSKDLATLCQTHLVPELRRGIHRKDETSYQCCISLIQYYLKHCPEGALKELLPFVNDEDDLDFFENVKHIQLHRRGRALKRMAAKIEEEELELTHSTATKVLLPIGQRYLLNETYLNQTELIESCMVFVTAVSQRLTLPHYLKLLEEIVKKRSTGKRFEKQRVEVISRLLRTFKFTMDEAAQEKHGKKVSELLSSLIRQVREDREASKVNGGNGSGHLPVLVSVAKLSSLLGQVEKHVQPMLLELCTRLKAKYPEDRELARKVLGQVMIVIGPRYLPLLLSNLDATLRRGYQIHILIHAVAHVLQLLSPQIESSIVPGLVEKTLGYVSMELFTDFSKEKTVSKILSKTPEAKKSVGFQILRLLASLTGKDGLKEIISPFLDSKVSGQSFESLARARKALGAVVDGLDTNKEIDANDKLLLAFGVLQGKMNFSTLISCVNLQQEFGLSLLLSTLRKDFMSLGEDNVYPFMKILCESVSSDNVEAVAVALKNLCFIAKQKRLSPVLTGVSTELIGRTCQALKRHQRSQDTRCFALACSLADGLLCLARQSWRKEELALVRSLCLAAVDKHPVKSLKVLANFLDQEDKEEVRKLLVMFCKIYLENTKQKTLDMIKFILLRESRRMTIPVEFMLQNFGYKGDIGRQRAIKFVEEVLRSKDIIPSETMLQKTFFLASFGLANDEGPETRRELINLLKQLVTLEAKEGRTIGISSTVNKWIDSENSIQLSLASHLVLLMCELGFGEAASPILAKLATPSLSDCTEEDPVLLSVKCNFVESCSRAITESNVAAMLADKGDRLADLILHPQEHLRLKVLELLSTGFNELSDKWKGSLKKMALNLLELLKSHPSLALVKPLQLFLGLSETSDIELPPLRRKLRQTFEQEARDSQHVFEKRTIVLEILREFMAQHPAAVQPITDGFFSLLIRNKDKEELVEKVEEVLAPIKRHLGDDYDNKVIATQKQRMTKKRKKNSEEEQKNSKVVKVD